MKWLTCKDIGSLGDDKELEVVNINQWVPSYHIYHL